MNTGISIRTTHPVAVTTSARSRDRLVPTLTDHAFATECRALTAALRALAPSAFSRPTRCDGWSVWSWRMSTSGRAASSTFRVRRPAPPTRTRSPTTAPPARTPRACTGQAAGRHQEASTVPRSPRTGGRSREPRRSRRPAAHAAATATRGPGPLGPVLALEDYVRTRVVEVGVHGLDSPGCSAGPFPPGSPGLRWTCSEWIPDAGPSPRPNGRRSARARPDSR
ncbi:maleylpyruvate isomerase N-terminal domain-containing protein [Actinomadura napierensis]|uniref:maleylpyruvate isomerase N-terminal domain-containing protein n=1 Tax=Actinomadura napierensis TaxID=267854 RepID=UPI00387EA1CF